MKVFQFSFFFLFNEEIHAEGFFFSVKFQVRITMSRAFISGGFVLNATQFYAERLYKMKNKNLQILCTQDAKGKSLLSKLKAVKSTS